jgi:hypothetical protein
MELHKVAGPVNAPAIGNKQSNAEAARRHQKWKTAKNADDLGKMSEMLQKSFPNVLRSDAGNMSCCCRP